MQHRPKITKVEGFQTQKNANCAVALMGVCDKF